MSRITLSAIKTDIGGCVGHTTVHPDVEEICWRCLDEARQQGKVGGSTRPFR
ncbi:MAG: fructose 1,6-bisphosphatase [Planctomycetes bacterium]|nr:fructose 1,6-bisphosphatase [Planctomycetota bacterium]